MDTLAGKVTQSKMFLPLCQLGFGLKEKNLFLGKRIPPPFQADFSKKRARQTGKQKQNC